MNNFRDQFESRLRRFSLDTIMLCVKIRKIESIYIIANQLMRSATSIGANVAEARGCGTKRDYTHFFETALKTANETIYWLSLVIEASPSLRTDAEKLLAEVKEISRIIGSSIITMKGKK